MARSLRWIAVLVLVAAAAILIFGLRMYRNDIKELKRFMAAYYRFDTAAAEEALRGQGGGSPDVRRALSELQAYAGMRLSSLIKNDGELMVRAREVAGLAQSEVEGRSGRLSEGSVKLTEDRKAAFARFLELARTSRTPGIITEEE